MRASLLLSLMLLLPCVALADDPEDESEEASQEEVEEEDSQPVRKARAMPMDDAHAQGRRDHVLSVLRVDSAIESLNDGKVQIYGTRREYRCPTGELVGESACSPCLRKTSEWGARPTGVWLFEISWLADDEEAHAEAVARLTHLQRYFELVPLGGAGTEELRSSFFKYTGKLKPPPEPSKAMRVRFFVAGQEVTAATVPAGSRGIEIEARAQRKDESSKLVDFPEAQLAFASDCGKLEQTGPGKASFELKPMVSRCDVRAVAEPGATTAVLGVRRGLELEITYEGTDADRVLLDGANVVELGWQARAISGEAGELDPQWKAEGGTVEKLEDGQQVVFRLAKGSARGTVTLFDEKSGAGDVISIERKQGK